MLRELKTISPTITYIAPKSPQNITLVSFSHASDGNVDESYGQSGSVTGLPIRKSDDHPALYHFLAWSSNKQQRTSYYSYRAKIHAATDAEDRAFDVAPSSSFSPVGLLSKNC